MDVRHLEGLAAFDALRAEWNALLDPNLPHAVFSRHEFVRTWFMAFGRGEPCLLVAERNGIVHGILPLQATHSRFAGLPLRRLDLMANGHSPCADLVVRPGREAEVAKAFAAYLQDADLAWDTSTCPEVQADSALARLCKRFPSDSFQVQPQRRAPYMRLEMDWPALRDGLSKNFQKALRNNRNRVARCGPHRIEELTTAGELEAGLDDMFAVGERSWQGAAHSAVGSSAANRAFYTGLVRSLGAAGLVRLWWLVLGGRRVAFELHVRHAGVEFGLKTGYDRGCEPVGAGTFLDQSIVERLCGEPSIREYDLLGDSDPYKLRWTAQARNYVRLNFFAASAAGRLASVWALRLQPTLRQVRAARRVIELGGVSVAVFCEDVLALGATGVGLI